MNMILDIPSRLIIKNVIMVLNITKDTGKMVSHMVGVLCLNF
jgi:hypothetical protein